MNIFQENADYCGSCESDEVLLSLYNKVRACNIFMITSLVVAFVWLIVGTLKLANSSDGWWMIVASTGGLAAFLLIFGVRLKFILAQKFYFFLDSTEHMHIHRRPPIQVNGADDFWTFESSGFKDLPANKMPDRKVHSRIIQLYFSWFSGRLRGRMLSDNPNSQKLYPDVYEVLSVHFNRYKRLYVRIKDSGDYTTGEISLRPPQLLYFLSFAGNVDESIELSVDGIVRSLTGAVHSRNYHRSEAVRLEEQLRLKTAECSEALGVLVDHENLKLSNSKTELRLRTLERGINDLIIEVKRSKSKQRSPIAREVRERLESLLYEGDSGVVATTWSDEETSEAEAS